MLAAQPRDWRAALGLLEDGDDLAIGKTGRLHAELSKNLNVENSTFKRDHLMGGLPCVPQLDKLSRKSDTAAAILYALNLWPALLRY